MGHVSQGCLFDLDNGEQRGQPLPASSELVSEPVLDLLRAAKVEDNTVLPMPQVERSVYEEFAEVIIRLRGKWKRGKGHVFPYDPTEAIAAVVASGQMPAKNPLAYFPTPAELARSIVADLEAVAPRMSPRTMLEPSAGSGALIRAALEEWPVKQIVAVEADPLNVATLRGSAWPRAEWTRDPARARIIEYREPEVEVVEGDFLDHDLAGRTFDLVLMNPPFSVGGDRDAWATHLRAAWPLVADRGRLACVAPGGTWRTSATRRWVEFRAWLDSLGAAIIEHPPGAFAESGTGIKTVTIVLQRYGPGYLTEPHCDGYPSMPAFKVWMWLENAWHDQRQALAHLPADHPEVRRFLRKAAVDANALEMGGVPVCDELLDQLAAGWSS